MCGKAKRPRVVQSPVVDPPSREESEEDVEERRKNRRKARGLSSTILTSPLGVSQQSTAQATTKRTLLGA